MNRVIIAALACTLAACSSVRLSYNQSPTLAWWWLDRYADFSSAQAPAVKAALQDWLAWHRSTQLGEYQQALAQLRGQLAEPMTGAQVCDQVAQWQQRGLRAFEQILPAAAASGRTFSAEQLRRVEQRLAKDLAEAEKDYLQPDPDDRKDAAFKRSLDRAEGLYGRLDDAQRKLLADGLASSPFDPQRWLDEKRSRQQDLLRAWREGLANNVDDASLRDSLRQQAQGLVSSPRAAYRQHAQQVMQAQCELSARVHNSTSAKQRRAAQEKVKGWEDDLRALQAQASR